MNYKNSPPPSIKSYVGSIEVHPTDKAEELITLFPGISHIENEPNLPEHGPGPPEY